MKQTLFLLALLIALPLSSFQAAAKSPRLTVIDCIDLGEIRSGQIMEQRLTIQNTGDADLVITSIASDCPCTGFQAPGQDGEYRILPPETEIAITAGAQIELKLIFDSNRTRFQGAFQKLIIIGSNDPERPLLRVKMAGRLIPAGI